MVLVAELLGVLFVVGVVIPFAWGLIRGPRPATPRSGGADEPMRPLGRIADIYASFFVLTGVLIALSAKGGYYGGGGSKGEACVDSGISDYSGGVNGERARPGTSLGQTGDLQACVLHPSAGQWTLFALTRVPGLVLWGCVLVLIIRLVRHAARSGPFTPRVASLMARLGWLIIAGCVVVGILKGLGSAALTDMVVTPRPFDTGTVVANALGGPIGVLLPVPALAGVALLSFGRMTRAGAVMDEELRATI